MSKDNLKNPLVSLVMSFSNSKDTLEAAIRSVTLQHYQNWELILINDGSNDGSLEIAEGFSDKRIHVGGDNCRKGLAARLNEAIDLTRGKYIARMDADDIAYPNRLAHQVRFLVEHPEIDLVGTMAIVFKNTGEPIGLLPTHTTHEKICKQPWSGFNLAHPTWMGKADWFLDHRYNPRVFKSQDQDLLLRTYETSRFACLPQVLMGYRQDALSIPKILHSRYYFAGILIARAWRLRQPVRMFLCVLEQFLKIVAEVVSISSGLDRQILRHRTLPATPEQQEEWRSCWTHCQKVGH